MGLSGRDEFLSQVEVLYGLIIFVKGPVSTHLEVSSPLDSKVVLLFLCILLCQAVDAEEASPGDCQTNSNQDEKSAP